MTPDRDIIVLKITPEGVVIGLPDGATGLLEHSDTNVLQATNAAHAKRSEQQQAVDMDFVRARADLWPAEVKLRFPLQLGDQLCATGTAFTVGRLKQDLLITTSPKFTTPVELKPGQSDFLEQFRAALDAAPEKPTQPLLRELQDKLVTLPTGRAKKARAEKVDPQKAPEYLLVYFSAGWCGPCHAFSPVLRKFYKKHKSGVGKRFEIVWVSRDHSEQEMLDYARELDFPWPSVAWDKLKDIPRTMALRGSGIPCLVLVDAHGAVLAHPDETGHGNAEGVLEELQKRLKERRR